MSNTFVKVGNNFRDRYEFARSHIKRETVLLQLSLTLILALAFFLRFMPAFMFPWSLSANDTYSQLIAAKAIDNNIDTMGFLGSLLHIATYVDPVMWYPNSGSRNFGTTQNLGIPLAGSITRRIFLLFGVNLSIGEASFLKPGFAGVVTVAIAYFLGKEIANKTVGLLAAFFLSFNPGHIQRSIVGFFDNESIGVMFMLLTFFLFLRALRTGSIAWSVFSGLSMSGLILSWGGYQYALELLSLYALILVLVKKYSLRLLTAFAGVIIPSISISVLWPREGPSSFLDITAVIPYGVLVILLLVSFYRNNKDQINRIPFVSGRNLELAGYLVVFGGVAFFILDFFIPVVPTFRSKFIDVIVPFYRNSDPIAASVAEQLIMTWGSMFNNLFALVFFIPLASIYLYRKPNENNIFLLVYMLTALYFSGSMVRLILILAPASAMASAKVVEEILLPYSKVLKNKMYSGNRKRSIYVNIGKEHIALTFIIFFVVFGFNLVQAFQNDANLVQPSSISMQFKTPTGLYTYGDWYQALDWLSRETPQNSIIASWWDYGYWLTLANRTIVVDGSTMNTTQIGNIGAMFMSTPDYALKIASYYDINYIVVLVANGQTQLDNDIGKVQWMVKISEASGHLDKIDGFPIKSANYFQYASDGTSIIGYENYFFKSLIWAFMTDGVSSTVQSNFKSNQLVSSAPDLTLGYASQYAVYRQVFQPVFMSTNNYLRIIKIDWKLAEQLFGVSK